MKYNTNNKPLECIMKNSTCYKGSGNGVPVGILWHDTGANNPNVKRYVQPHESDSNYSSLIKKIGDNRYNNDWNHITCYKGVNAFIGKVADGSVCAVQTLPWTRRPWGCGRGTKGSCNGTNGGKFWIQLEICADSYNDKGYFDKVYKEACELTAYICKQRNIDPNGKVIYNGVSVPTILCHADANKLGLASNHGDVLTWFRKHGKTMDDVRKDVSVLLDASEPKVIKTNDVVKIASDAIYYSGRQVPSWVKSKTWIVKSVSGDRVVIDKSADGKSSICSPINTKYLTVVEIDTSAESPSEFVPYKIRVTANTLNIRKGAGTNYAKVSYVKNGGVYTIVDESSGKGANKWGLLKSYEKNRNGWISLDYVERI